MPRPSAAWLFSQGCSDPISGIDWSAEWFVKYTHISMLHIPSDQRKFVQGLQNPVTSLDDKQNLKVCAAINCCAPAQAMTENIYGQGWVD